MQRFLLALLSLAVSVASVAAEPPDTVRLGVQDDTLSLDPAKSYEAMGWSIINKVYEKLVAFQKTDLTQPVPELAKSWELGEDGRTWVFHLRHSAFFPDGQPVNADAVIFSLRRALRVGGESAERPTWMLTQFGITGASLTKLDDFRVQIVLDQPYAPALFLACLAGSAGSILNPAVVMAHEQNGDLGSAWLETHSAGSGPYRIAERLPGERLVLQRNPHAWKARPTLNRVIVQNVQEPIEQLAMLLRGELDMALNLQPEQLHVLADHPDFQIYEARSFDMTHLLMNLNYAPLQKSEVRDAIRYAIDYDGLIDAIFDGKAVKIQTCIPKGLVGYNPATPYSPDLEQARTLLAAAGYADGFPVTLNHFSFSPWIEIGLKIKHDLARIGIQVEISQAPVAETLKTRDYQLTLIEWTPDYLDPDGNAKAFAYAGRLDKQAPIKLRAWQAHYRNPSLTRLVEQAAQELDRERRRRLYAEITTILLDDGPYAFIYSPIQQYAIRRELLDFIKEPVSLWFELPL